MYTPERIDAQLDIATRNFIAHEVQVDQARGELRLSQIFNWYQVDFGGTTKMLDFICAYLPKGVKNIHQFRIIYLNYDWGLNL